MISRRAAATLYSVTLVIFAAMTPLRWWLESKIGVPYTIPDLMFGLDAKTLLEFQSAMSMPVGSVTGATWFLRLHTFSLDLVLPALTALSFSVFFWRTGAQLPSFDAMERRAKIVACIIISVPGMMVDYFENYQVARLLTNAEMPTAKTASIISALTTLKFSCLVFATLVCGSFLLAALNHKKSL